MATRRQLGGISGEFSSMPVTRRRYPDTEQRIATHSLRRKMARSQAERDRPITGRQKPSPAAGVVFYRVQTVPVQSSHADENRSRLHRETERAHSRRARRDA